jgi:hypothetical protein
MTGPAGLDEREYKELVTIPLAFDDDCGRALLSRMAPGEKKNEVG